MICSNKVTVMSICQVWLILSNSLILNYSKNLAVTFIREFTPSWPCVVKVDYKFKHTTAQHIVS
jgi:hypothetical protein